MAKRNFSLGEERAIDAQIKGGASDRAIAEALRISICAVNKRRNWGAANRAWRICHLEKPAPETS